MATLLISAGANLALGFALNALFPPPDQEVEGPRLTDLGFTSPSLGKPMNITFGTDRLDGSIVDNQDPAIEEVTSESSEDIGKGGGQSLNTTSFTYFLTCRIAFGIEGAKAVLRMWADGKLVYDATASGQVERAGLDLVFYPGGPAQVQDPEEVSRRGADVSAYRHLTTVKLNKLPLADFGNRIPNFTAEIAYATTTSNPFISLTEPPGYVNLNSNRDYMLLNAARDEVYGLNGAGAGGNADYLAASASALGFTTKEGGPSNSVPTVGLNGVSYRQTGLANAGPIQGVDVDTGTVLFTKGNSGITLTDDGVNNWGNSGFWSALQLTTSGLGVRNILCHLNGSGTANGSFVDADLLPTHNGGAINANIDVLGTGDGFPSQVFNGAAIPDHDRGRFFVFSENGSTSAGTLQLMQVDFTFAVNTEGDTVATATYTVKREFTKGDAGDDFPTNGVPEGWAVDRATGNLILSTASDMVLYNPDTDTVLARRAGLGFESRNNFYNGSRLGFFSGGSARIVDTRDLTTIGSFSIGTVNPPTTVWEDRTQALFVSVPGAAVDSRMRKVFLDRVAAAGVSLESVMVGISTTYNNLRMAGLEDADVDFSALSGDTVPGYTLNNGGSFRAAVQPLRDRFFMDVFQSDWLMTAAKRGGASVLAIPEQDVGQLRRDRGLTDNPPVREIHAEDVRLPARLGVRYRNKDADYSTDLEHDKRQFLPNPTMRSRKDRTLTIPMVDTPTNMRRVAQQWLFTFWDERRAFKTVVPWTYLPLDPSDIFEMELFGETHVLRMTDQDVGAGMLMDITGVVQDSKQFSSNLRAGTNLGFASPSVPSGLPTTLVPLDAPLLSLADLRLTGLSDAYVAFSALEDGWPGGTSMKSLDDVDFEPTSTANAEVALGTVQTAPGAWGFVEGDFRNRIQEVAEGGTMRVTTLRRAGEWTSATELAVMNGANAVAVVRGGDGQVEVLQFVDVTVNTDNTVTLDRLLRGRLGTEDVTDLGVSVGDKAVLLADSTGSNAVSRAAVQKQNLLLPELGVPLLFRGVTVGTLLEDAVSISKTYTGRDIRPFSVVHTSAVNNAGDVDVDWERRVRGPSAGELLDGTGIVPLNETLEQYEVTITDGVDSLTETVNGATSTTFTAGDLSAAGVSGASTVTVAQVGAAGTTFKSPITPSSTATVTV